MTENKVLCPWCLKGEVYSDGSGDVSVTVRCPKCQHFFTIRLDSFTTEKVQARKRIANTRCRLSRAALDTN